MTQAVGSQRVLVLDDEAAFGQLAAQVIGRLGVPVTSVRTTREFCEAYVREQPSVLVLDIVLDREDVCGVLDFLGTRHCRVPVILVSGFDYRMRDFVAGIARNRGLHVADTIDKRDFAGRLVHQLQRHLVAPVPHATP